MPTWVESGQKIFVWKSWFLRNGKHFSEKHYDVMLLTPFLHFLYFPFLSNHNGFVLSCLTWSVLYNVKSSSVFKFINFSLKQNYNNIVVYSVNGSYLFSRERQEKKFLKQFLIKFTVYLLIFRQTLWFLKGVLIH